jgi:carboxymethylenebutenolidase
MVNDIEPEQSANRVYVVLPEVFGVNAWVRSVADRLAAYGYPALAVPLFVRTTLGLELAYDASDLAEGRRNKDATTTEQILGDVAAAVS